MGFVSRRIHSLNSRVFKRVGRPEIRDAFISLGICPGDTVFAHISLKSLGYVTGGAPEVLEALREVLGASGTLMMSAWSAPDARPDSSVLFEVAATPSACGSLSEAMRTLKEAVRSLHPIASVVALGARAAELIEGHEQAPTPFGAGSPYAKVAALSPKFLLVGAHLGGMLLHLQDKVDFPNMYERLPREFELRDAGGHYRRVTTPVLRPQAAVVILPGSRAENRDYLLVPDYAFMFPADRERRVMEAGYLRFNRSRFLGRRERLNSRGILKVGRVGSTEAALLDGARMLDQIEKDLAWDITRFKDEYDPEVLGRINLPVL